MMGGEGAIFCNVSCTPSGDKREGRDVNPEERGVGSLRPEFKLSLEPKVSSGAPNELGPADGRNIGLAAGLL